MPVSLIGAAAAVPLNGRILTAAATLPPGPEFGLNVGGVYYTNLLEIYSSTLDYYDEYHWQINDGSGWNDYGNGDSFGFQAEQPFGPMSWRVRVKISGAWTDWSAVQSLGVTWQPYGLPQSENCDSVYDYQCCATFADGNGGSFGGCGGQNSYNTLPPFGWAINGDNFLVDGEPTSSGAQIVWPAVDFDGFYGVSNWGGTADTRKYVLTGPSGDVDVAWTATTYFMSLPAGTTSTVTIKAVSYGGETASGVTLSITTPSPATAPDAPTSLSGTAGNGQVSLTWTAPASNGGAAITDYAVQYSSNSGSTWATFADGTSTDTSATVTGLTNGTAYTFRVAAVNSVGTGSYSSASASVTPSITAEYLVVAGGGAMRDFYQGAGGAGGLLTGTMSLTAGTAYSVAVGAGGASIGGSYYNGANSQFASLTAIGGGRGGNYSNGFAGGSGGGGGTGGQPGQGTTGQGYSGGYGSCAGGSGGGAGGAGIEPSTYIDGDGDTVCVPPAGGDGYTSSITGAATEYARGGSRITGGQNTTAMPGAGGSAGSYAGRNGVVIIAYQGPPLTSISAGLTYTYSTTSRSGYKVYTFTRGSGTITP
jgi:hypothetical protein